MRPLRASATTTAEVPEPSSTGGGGPAKMSLSVRLISLSATFTERRCDLSGTSSGTQESCAGGSEAANASSTDLVASDLNTAAHSTALDGSSGPSMYSTTSSAWRISATWWALP